MEINSEQFKQIVAKHGANFTYRQLCDFLKVPCEKKVKAFKKPHSTKNLEEIKLLLRMAGYTYELEHRFHDVRKFRFDIAFPEIKLAVEYNGIFSAKSRHTTAKGYSMDREKINLAQSLGWTVFEYTPLNFTNVVLDVENFFKNRVADSGLK